jgi:hypothetical protein
MLWNNPFHSFELTKAAAILQRCWIKNGINYAIFDPTMLAMYANFSKKIKD